MNEQYLRTLMNASILSFMSKNEGSKRLEQWRGKRTKAEVGLLLGCTGQEVGRLESGAKPSVDRAFCIEHATDGYVMVSDWVDTKTKKELKR